MTHAMRLCVSARQSLQLRVQKGVRAPLCGVGVFWFLAVDSSPRQPDYSAATHEIWP